MKLTPLHLNWIWPVALVSYMPVVLAVEFKPPLCLAEKAPTNVDVTQYWVSEKLDGVRAYWDGRQLLSRSGLPIAIPAGWTDGWPAVALDGELWIGRGQFERINGLVHKQNADPVAWKDVHYMVFDAPNATGSFVARMRQLDLLLGQQANEHLRQVAQQQFSGMSHLMKFYEEIIRQGGEGVMLRSGVAAYESGRSHNLLKMKPFDDAEGRVVGYIAGKGKYQDATGALKVEMSNGLVLAVGSGLSDQLRLNPPSLGTVITIRYSGLTRYGKPRHARFYRLYTP